MVKLTFHLFLIFLQLQIENAQVSSQSTSPDFGLRISRSGMYLCIGRADGRPAGDSL